MLFKFKNPKIVLDCFTSDPMAYELGKINYGKNFYPEWFKKTPLTMNNHSTIRSCLGLTDFYKTGIVIPSWFSLKIDILPNEDGSIYYDYFFNSHGPELINHNKSQYSNFSDNTKENLKISTPWAFRCNKDIKFVWSQPTWHDHNILSNMHLLPAVLDFYNQNTANISWMITSKTVNSTIEINPLDPLVILHPMTEKKVFLKNHLVSEKEYLKITSLDLSVMTDSPNHARGLYQKKIKIKQKQKELEKCPVHSTDHTKK